MPEPREYTHLRDNGVNALALFSEDRRYRYLLELIWCTERPMLMFVMSHPSTATEVINDSTVSACENRAMEHHQRFGGHNFGGIYVTNLFAFVQQSTACYERVPNQIGSHNNRIIQEYARKPDTTVVCAWGNGGKGIDDERFFIQADLIKNRLHNDNEISPLQHFEQTGLEQPRHLKGFNSGRDFVDWPLVL